MLIICPINLRLRVQEEILSSSFIVNVVLGFEALLSSCFIYIVAEILKNYASIAANIFPEFFAPRVS